MSETKRLIIGIDPGLSGAVAFYDFKGGILESVYDMPLAIKQNGKKEIEPYLFSQFIDLRASAVCLAMIEEVHSMPKQGVASTFTFGFAAGLVTGIVAAFGIPIIKSPPSVWKTVMGLSADKAKSREKATALFPTSAASFKRAKDDGRAEAALLAKFGERFALKF